jgi:tetratricopeptide (TPR) repeat protein
MTSSQEIDALTMQARKQLRANDVAGAVATFEKALDAAPERLDLHEGVATAHFLSGSYEQAVEHFKRASELDPRQGKALINLGAVYNRMGQFSEAIKVLRRGIQKEKNHAEGFFNMGYAHRGLNQQSMAVSAYREAVRLDPKFIDAHVNLAKVYLELRNYQQTIMHCNLALEVNPTFERALKVLKEAKTAKSNSSKAISPFGRLVDTRTAGAKGPSRMSRELGDTERLQDRQTVNALVTDAEASALELMQLIKSQLDPMLSALNRTVTQGSDGALAVADIIGDYQAAVNQCREARRKLKRKLLELRAHEELINSPDLKTP